MNPRTVIENLWHSHVVHEQPGAPTLLYIDLHLVHEVTSPQAFEGLRQRGLKVRRPDLTFATADHSIPTTDRSLPIVDQIAAKQLDQLEANCKQFGIPLEGIHGKRQGIVHVIGPELGLTQPGMTVVCGDSHPATHGAFGALGFGIGTSEVEHVLATQCLLQPKPRSMRVLYTGELGYGVTAKDLILGTIGQMGVSGGQGYVIEFAGDPIEKLSMEGRMTVCNITIEGGGQAGMIAPDETTFEWLRGRPAAPAQIPDEWRDLHTD